MGKEYKIITSFSQQDHAFIAQVFQLSGCMAHGDTEEEAPENIRIVIDLWIRTGTESSAGHTSLSEIVINHKKRPKQHKWCVFGRFQHQKTASIHYRSGEDVFAEVCNNLIFIKPFLE
ncbi:type II toxin-antitoxin system HicB family antitoxin [Dyadobacter tibetensis]|uniref:type II toxin-antitoxin system HicB family antitoxin n=1 Tax=Dyadobacter tibetensis TaxID=1211851 RepID=UPI00047010F8|nr:type II toxin-antitoxin system HicB family antitoxin [Dyadobacter tibetensis]